MQIPNVDDGIMTPSESQHHRSLAGTKKSSTPSTKQTKQNSGSASSTISRPSATITSQQIIPSPTTTTTQDTTSTPNTSTSTSTNPPNTTSTTTTTSQPQPHPRSSPRGAGNHSPSGRMHFDWDDYLEGIRPRGSSTPAHSNHENDAANHGMLSILIQS